MGGFFWYKKKWWDVCFRDETKNFVSFFFDRRRRRRLKQNSRFEGELSKQTNKQKRGGSSCLPFLLFCLSFLSLRLFSSLFSFVRSLFSPEFARKRAHATRAILKMFSASTSLRSTRVANVASPARASNGKVGRRTKPRVLFFFAFFSPVYGCAVGRRRDTQSPFGARVAREQSRFSSEGWAHLYSRHRNGNE